MLRVIDGGLSRRSGNLTSPSVTAAAVRAEAMRRCAVSGVTRQRNREALTGVEMDPKVKYLGLQIDFTAESLIALNPIPEDYKDDMYWPR